MRRLLSVLVTLLPLALPALADEPKPATLTATGEGIVMATPDIAVVTIGVVSNGRTAEAALASNASDMSAAIATIKAAGVAEKDIGTSGFYVNPIYPPDATRTRTAVEGHRLSRHQRGPRHHPRLRQGRRRPRQGDRRRRQPGERHLLRALRPRRPRRPGPEGRGRRSDPQGRPHGGGGEPEARPPAEPRSPAKPAARRPYPTARFEMAKAATPIMAGQQQVTANVTAVFEIAPK